MENSRLLSVSTSNLWMPPESYFAMGLDRVSALLAGRENIREVIAFPKATSGGDPLTGAPAPVETSQLRELGLRLA